ncbi:hypothetical protein [Burkholderia ubonensis]|uniref:Uncharacterized protein n=1 Tax=Burkholderia ubonensis TaxID=101571 RepID=A0ABD4DZF9_9BURK|nr:hypothetical protein [Burkholderia ubonensis]KVN81591.1 hypothetical protein WJ68_20200 [Burkholderia ubonensis]KVZ53505.1 hypothetical protein WL19_10060 [Burkholderia ubonensis]KVZ91586.1 hypothetical protein WL24_03735 [Burkholderia ubonensis]
MQELNHRDISLVSGGAFFFGSVTAHNVGGHNSIVAGILIEKGANVIINGKPVAPNSSSIHGATITIHGDSISMSDNSINGASTSYISLFRADWPRNFFNYF